ncbi:MAG: glutamine-hydrolyzing GMP synthase, partial [Desulfobacterales bacterium]
MILIIDFGSQFNQLIARRVRESKVYCQIVPPTISADEVRSLAPQGIILSGGPASIYEDHSPQIDRRILDLGLPILGICYGMQFMVHALGGKVKRSSKREYGFAEFRVKRSKPLFASVPAQTPCWMSHGDSITKLPPGFIIAGSTENTRIAAIYHRNHKLFGLQFHPEVEHTPQGQKMLHNFLFMVCGCKKSWTMQSFA